MFKRSRWSSLIAVNCYFEQDEWSQTECMEKIVRIPVAREVTGEKSSKVISELYPLDPPAMQLKKTQICGYMKTAYCILFFSFL